jgi:hypothetical protein
MIGPLTVAQLFQPMPSGVGAFGAVPTVPAQGTWLALELELAGQLGLQTTSWQSGAPELTIFGIEAVAFSMSDVDISIMAQGGFLQSAASGSVTYVTQNGSTVTQAVTPDPSNAAQNPTGALGWEDLLAANVYDVERLAATQAAGPLAIVNVTGLSKGPYAIGAYHVQSLLGPTYSNEEALTIPSSIIGGSGGTISGVAPGAQYTIVTTASAHGLTPGDPVYVVLPATSGVTIFPGGQTPGSGFALVVSSTATTLQIAVPSSGTWTAGGTIYAPTTATMIADVAGIGSNAGPGVVTTAVTQNANVYVSNLVGWSGSNWESNTDLANRCILSLAARSPNGANQAYVYFAETAYQILQDATPSYTLTNGPVTAEAFANPQTGIVTVAVASVTPASTTLGDNVTPGCAQLPVVGVSNTLPCVVTCSGATGLAPAGSMQVTIDGVLGVAGVNSSFVGTYVSANSFSIPLDTTSAGAYAGGGQVEGGDLGAIDLLLQNNVVPDNTTEITTSALALPITITATVVVPQAYVAQYQLAVIQQLQTQLASYSIGGDADSNPPNSVAWDDILAALEEAGVVTLGQPSYVVAVQSLTVAGNSTTATSSGTGIAFPGDTYQAIFVPASITVIGV